GKRTKICCEPARNQESPYDNQRTPRKRDQRLKYDRTRKGQGSDTMTRDAQTTWRLTNWVLKCDPVLRSRSRYLLK
ncbi:hypothetical protein PanWU01x14_139150, partial [Parasponia andersonii]